MLLALSLWLDLRGKPCADDLSVLLDLYGGVRKRFDRDGLPPPRGATVTGILHLAPGDLEEEDGADGELSLLALEPEGGRILRNGEPAGVAIAASAGVGKSQLNAAALEAIRRPEEHLLLLGAETAVLPLFEFALAQAQHCRGISGCKTALLAEVRGAGGLRAVRRAETEDEAGVPLGVVMPPDPGLWYAAMAGRVAEGARQGGGAPAR